MRIFLKNRTSSTRYNATQYLINAKWSGSKSSCARRVDADLSLDSSGDMTLPCEIMDIAYIEDDNGKELFTGRIWARSKRTNINAVSITAFDDGYYLKQSDGFYRFVKSTPKDIVKKIASDNNIKLGTVVDPNFRFTRNYQGVPLYKIIQDAYTRASEENGVQYQIIFRNGKLNITKRGDIINNFNIKSGDNLISAEVKENAQSLLTRVKIYDSDGKFVKNIDNTNDLKIFGLIQRTLMQSSGDNRVKAANKLLKENTLSRTIALQSFGDERCVTGSAVNIKEPTTGLTGVFYIDEDEHTWKGNQYTNKLTLNFINVMENVVAGGDATADSSSNRKVNGANTTLYTLKKSDVDVAIDKMLEWALAHTTANSGWKYSQSKRFQNGYRDCSSYVYSAWEAAGVKMRISGALCQTACTEVISWGFEFVYGDRNTLDSQIGIARPVFQKVDFNTLKPGDLIFYAFKNYAGIYNGRRGNISHVAIVYTNNLILHARNDSVHILMESINYGKDNIVAVTRYTGKY